jgi:hypothetical protein
MRASVVVRVAGLFVASALPVRAEIEVRAAGRVDLAAAKAPLSEVLERLGEKTGMRVAFEGAPRASSSRCRSLAGPRWRR